MKQMNATLICLLLFGGCTARSTMTRDETADDGKDAYFLLKDGTFVQTFAGKHQRAEDGYQVIGTIRKKGMLPENFAGFVADGDIERISIEEFNTIGAVAVFVIFVGGTAAFISTLEFVNTSN